MSQFYCRVPGYSVLEFLMRNPHRQGPGSLFMLSWPLFIDLSLHFLTGAINTFMVSHISYREVAALAVGNQVFSLAITLFSFVSIGTSVVITQYLGAGDNAKARTVIHTAISFNLVVGLLAAVGVISSATPILTLMNLPQDLLADGQLYLMIVGLCLLPEAAALCLAATLRAHGYTREAMYATAVVNLITFGSNLLLLYGWFGLPQMGVAGVAISTVAGRLFGLVLLVWLLQRNTGIRLLPTELLRPQREMLAKVLKIGLPAAGENLSWLLQFMVVTSFVGLMGDQALATHAYYFQICTFIMLFGLSIGMGNEIIIGHLAGGRLFELAYTRLLKTLKIGLLATIIIATGFALSGRSIVGLFTGDEGVLSLIAPLFFISVFMEPGRTFNLIVINALRATGDARFPLMMALFSMWGIAVPLAWLLGIHFGYGLVGIWLALACDEWVRGLAMYWRWCSRRWQGKVLVEPLQAATH
ncbi:MATE family efflux transporter [Shewanella fodinae]|uniref:MATE family efflux transporter n=1 Tax=Shewanella fodinae TaxID=552357 RepID=UPI0019CE0F4B|nr:MATE family efflux transporter [Shewanella fodinae]MCL2906814.1 MATE family efflux transporter [Shewanella fodinae]GGZ03751.1 MATE family efflux transporter [Shewanella fodinae]